MRELEVIDRLRKAFPGCGIGDDAAVLPPIGGEILFAADAVVESVHFDRRFSTLSQAVQKLVTSNVSDIFAMGGAPLSIVFTAALPRGCSAADVEGIIDGLRRSCVQYGLKLVGGDTVLSPHGFVFNVAIVGEVIPGRAIPRSGARTGDAIVLFGAIGGSLAGLGILSALFGETGSGRLPAPRIPGLATVAASMKKELPALSIATSASELSRMARVFNAFPLAEETMRFAQQHLVPVACPLDAPLLDAEPPCVTAMIDVSDGLAKDLRTLCEESGVGAVIREGDLPVPGGIGGIFGLHGPALVDFALSSGEEYVMLATMTGAALRKLSGVGTVIGTIGAKADGIVLVGGDGTRRPLPKLGYEHTF